MAEIKITFKMDEELRKSLSGIVTRTVHSIPSSFKDVVRSGARDLKIPVKEIAEDISKTREELLLALLPDELRPKQENKGSEKEKAC
ncbi:MAG: hypothetical protein IJ091_00995 [Oscillospiraceae bacterium]|nr:hypothetical protein [Oscillospiraceae bacterium]